MHVNILLKIIQCQIGIVPFDQSIIRSIQIRLPSPKWNRVMLKGVPWNIAFFFRDIDESIIDPTAGWDGVIAVIDHPNYIYKEWFIKDLKNGAALYHSVCTPKPAVWKCFKFDSEGAYRSFRHLITQIFPGTSDF